MVEKIAIYSKSTIVLGIKGSVPTGCEHPKTGIKGSDPLIPLKQIPARHPLIPQPSKLTIMTLKNDLALLYFPNLSPCDARKQLNRYIQENQSLIYELQQAGFDCGKKCSYFTPKEVEIIEKHLGKPS